MDPRRLRFTSGAHSFAISAGEFAAEFPKMPGVSARVVSVRDPYSSVCSKVLPLAAASQLKLESHFPTFTQNSSRYRLSAFPGAHAIDGVVNFTARFAAKVRERLSPSPR